jgi:hypothetical protein
MAGTIGRTGARVQAANAQAAGLEYEARAIEGDTKFAVQQERRKQRILQGQGNAIAAASGLDITSGSPLLLELDRVRQGELEVQSLKRAGGIAITTKRYGASLVKGAIPYRIMSGALQGGSILTSYITKQPLTRSAVFDDEE